MKKLQLAFLLLLLAAGTLTAQDEKTDFEGLLKRTGMTFRMPEGYSVAEVSENPHVSYDYAIRNDTKVLEVRYAVFPMDVELQLYEEALNDSTKTMMHPNLYAHGVPVAVSMNISEGGPYNRFAPLPGGGLKTDFNADNGTVSLCNPKKSFADYQYCLVVWLFKEDKGAGYCFYLADDQQVLKDAMKSEVFKSLKFE